MKSTYDYEIFYQIWSDFFNMWMDQSFRTTYDALTLHMTSLERKQNVRDVMYRKLFDIGVSK